MKEDAWQLQVERKVHEHWALTYPGVPYPWRPHRNDPLRAATSYARMPAADRVRALKLLCDLRLDQEDIQNRMSKAAGTLARPPKKRKKQKQGTVAVDDGEETLERFQEQTPFCKDDEGGTYW